jgi:hypothetical protein
MTTPDSQTADAIFIQDQRAARATFASMSALAAETPASAIGIVGCGENGMRRESTFPAGAADSSAIGSEDTIAGNSAGLVGFSVNAAVRRTSDQIPNTLIGDAGVTGNASRTNTRDQTANRHRGASCFLRIHKTNPTIAARQAACHDACQTAGNEIQTVWNIAVLPIRG